MISDLKFRLYSVIFLSIVSLLSCAEVAGPPGGPRDETAPTISLTMPASETVNMLPDNNEVLIYFSEWINPKGIEEAIFISPRPQGKMEYSLKKNLLRINFPESFKNNTTYVITLGTGIKDLRGNRLEESYSFAFSTGETIDKGSIEGFVYENNKLTAGIKIGLYDYSIIDSLLFLDSLYPPYLTQSGKKGEFKFEYLPSGKYLLIAYSDKNKNQLLNYPAEKFGLPDRFVTIENNKISAININMTAVDTTTLSIISATYSSDNLVKLRFSKDVSGQAINNNLDDILLVSAEYPDTLIRAVSVKESKGGEMAVFNFHFENITDGSYKLKVGEKLLKIISDDSSYSESSEFGVMLSQDSTKPKIEYCSIDKKKIFPKDNNFEIGFSEPMNINIISDSSLLIYDSDDLAKDVTVDWIDDFRLGVTLEKPLWGKEYFIVLDENKYSDKSGNSLGDSISVFMFGVLNIDSLGEASGTVEYSSELDSSKTSYITVHEISKKKQYSQEVSNNQFKFNLPPGEYLLSGFIDASGNSVFDAGSLDPFKLSETMVQGTDTIRVRARFETAGLRFRFK